MPTRPWQRSLLAGSGSAFSGGADIRVFGCPEVFAAPTLHEVIACMETSRKPVIAAVHGMALGGGLELATGAHCRVFAPQARVALPDVTLGLVPGSGGTQRLSRLLGVEKALAMIMTGDAVNSETLFGMHAQKLIDSMAV